MIRPFELADEADLIEIFKQNTPTYFDPKEMKDFLNFLVQNPMNYLVIEYKGKVIGGVGYLIHGSKKMGEITWILFNPDFRAKGYGRIAVEHCLTIFREIGSVTKLVVKTSQLAFLFFEKFGFKVAEVQKNYWGKGLDLYLMTVESWQ